MKLAVAGFQHETNTFSDRPATFQDFVEEDAWPGLLEGAEILEVMTARNIPIAGFLDAAACDETVEIVPLVWCQAEPCAAVTAATFDRISSMIVHALKHSGPVDGLYLDLHGAMVSEHHEDGEGELLRRIRALTGPDLPIVASLDLHANVSQDMVNLATGMTACRTYPHIDMDDAGARAFKLLRQGIGSEQIHAEFRQAPFLLPAASQATVCEPAQSLYRSLGERVRDGVLNVELLMGFEAADIAGSGPSVYVCGTDPLAVKETVDRLLEDLLAAEPAFNIEILEPEKAVRKALTPARRGPVVIADVQDNPGGGAPSDTVGMLEALVSEQAPASVFGLLHDPEAAQIAHEAGEGAVLDLDLGGKSQAICQKPYSGRFIVEKLGDGNFPFTGEYLGGSNAVLGPMALLRVDGTDVQVAVSTKRCQCLDTAIFRHLGVALEEQRIVVVKSVVHFRADFAPLAADILLAEAPGLTKARVEQREYQHLRTGVRLGPCGSLYQNLTEKELSEINRM